MLRRALLLTVLAACAAEGAGSAESTDEVRFGAAPVDTALPDVDTLGYEVELAVDDAPGKESFRASVKGTYVATRDLDELVLDFEGHRIDDIRVEGRPAPHRRRDGRLVVTLPARVRAGSTFSTLIAYRGDVAQAESMNPDDFVGFGGFMVKQKNADGERIYTTMSWPQKTRRWLPVVDHPRDTAMITMRATFPKTFTVLANGTRIGTKENADGTRTWTYEALTPMPTYDFHVSAYEHWKTEEKRSTSGMPITAYSYPSAPAGVYRDISRAFDFYESTFGPYRWSSLSFVEEPIFGGGMEHASVVSMDETLFADPAEARAVAFHELAHHWSGNAVHFRTWNDFWLSEGFTEYLSGRALARLDGPEAGRLVWRDYWKRSLEAEAGGAHALAPRGAEIDVLSIFDAISYQRGALTLRMLAAIVGEDRMDTFLKGWFTRHGLGAAVTTDDLERELGAETGVDLHAFFESFVRTAGHPELRVTARDTTLTIEQLQPGAAVRFPLDVEVDGSRVRVELTGKTTQIPLAKRASSLVVDPDEVALAVLSCGASGGAACREGFRCLPQREGVSACIPR